MEIHRSCCISAELAAVVKSNLHTEADTGRADNSLKIVTENAAFARKVFMNIKKKFGVSPEIGIRRSLKLKKHVLYIIAVTKPAAITSLMEAANMDFSRMDNCCRRSFLRGAFLAMGSVSDPEKAYHLEIKSHNRSEANEMKDLINGFGLNAKVVKRKSNYITYL
jgi:DNA-binding protein WhiA